MSRPQGLIGLKHQNHEARIAANSQPKVVLDAISLKAVEELQPARIREKVQQTLRMFQRVGGLRP